MGEILGAAGAFSILGSLTNYAFSWIPHKKRENDIKRHNLETERISKERMKHDFDRQQAYNSALERRDNIHSSDYNIAVTNKQIDYYDNVYNHDNTHNFRSQLPLKTKQDGMHTVNEAALIIGIAAGCATIYAIFYK